MHPDLKKLALLIGASLLSAGATVLLIRFIMSGSF